MSVKCSECNYMHDCGYCGAFDLYKNIDDVEEICSQYSGTSSEETLPDEIKLRQQITSESESPHLDSHISPNA